MREADDPGAVEQIGPYRVIRELSRGGMGAVHEVVHAETGVAYALKRILHFQGGDAGVEEELARFEREVETMAKLRHPNVARIHAAQCDGPIPYLVMDLLTGGTLHDLIQRGPLDVPTAVSVTLKLAGALEHLHERGVLHRDLKPQNVLFDDRGEPQLVDFGLALVTEAASRLTKTGAVMGTPAYMAPEQAIGTKDADARTDVYALGALFYGMLTGHAPFSGTSVYVILDNVVNTRPTPPHRSRPGVPEALSALCMRALKKSPADRQPTARAFADELRLATHTPRSRRGVVLALALLAFVAIGLATFLAVGPSKTTDAPSAQPTHDPHKAEAEEARLEIGRALQGLGEGSTRALTRRVATLIKQHAFEPTTRQSWAQRIFAWALVPTENSDALGSRAATVRELLPSLRLSEEQARKSKSNAWAACRDAWAERLLELTVGLESEASAFGHLRDVLSADPKLPAAEIGSVTSQATAALLEREEISRAVALQAERNHLELPPSRALVEAVANAKDTGIRDLNLITTGVNMRRTWSYKPLRYPTEAAQEALARLSRDSQLRAFVALTRQLHDEPQALAPKGLAPCLELAEQVLSAERKDLGLRGKLETQVIRLTLLLRLHKEGRRQGDVLQWARQARVLRRRLQQASHPDRLLLLAARLETRLWARVATPDSEIRATEAWAEAADAVAAAGLERPRAHTGHVHEPCLLFGTLLQEQASDLTNRGLIDGVDAILQRAQAQAKGVRAELLAAKPNAVLGGFPLSVAREQLRTLLLQERYDEARELALRHDDPKSADLQPSYLMASIRLWVHLGELDTATKLLKWLEARPLTDGNAQEVLRRVRPAVERALRDAVR